MQSSIVALLTLFILTSCATPNKDNTTTFSTTKKEEQPVTTFQSGDLLTAVTNQEKQRVSNILASSYSNINETNDALDTPLHLAIYTDQIEVAKQLIDYGANINQQNKLEDSPYLYAGAEGKTDILAYMLEHGSPDLAVVNRYGGNTLIPAAEKGHLDTVILLLKDGREDLNFQNRFGYTALIEAVALTDGSKIFQDIVRELMDHGADKHIEDQSGQTASDYAQALGYDTIQHILAEYP